MSKKKDQRNQDCMTTLTQLTTSIQLSALIKKKDNAIKTKGHFGQSELYHIHNYYIRGHYLNVYFKPPINDSNNKCWF